MRLDELPKSQRVEDRRGMTAGRAAAWASAQLWYSA